MHLTACSELVFPESMENISVIKRDFKCKSLRISELLSPTATPPHDRSFTAAILVCVPPLAHTDSNAFVCLLNYNNDPH